MSVTKITSPDDPALEELCAELARLANDLDVSGEWPARQLQLCGEYGVFEWFLEPQWGGQAWDDEAVVRGHLALSSACLTTTFVLTQRTGACRRIASAQHTTCQQQLLPDLVSGQLMATVGISHLTTSRRHLARPVLRAKPVDGGYLLDGFSPWVTGAAHSDYVVVGATITDDEDEATDKQLLVALPTDLPGVSAPAPAQLVGVGASHTGELRLQAVFVEQRWVIAGPIENVLSVGSGAGAGGYQTSTLALGLARSAIDFLATQSLQRSELGTPLEALQQEFNTVQAQLFSVVRGDPACSSEELRQRANSLTLRSAQAALAAAKGTGYIVGHPAGRWCREALFFLVWSCPQPVLAANLCELAGLASE
ncbi:MAG: acyl-CoA dehydrogenase family protein [Planctomycetota bacterium]